MAYNLQDIYVDSSGDFEISANGDLRISNSFETVKQTCTFIVKTDKGGYVPDISLGGDLGSFLGRNLSKDILVSMEKSLTQNLGKVILNRSDFEVHCVPISMDEVGVFVAIDGEYLDQDGNTLETTPEVISFTFPYGQGDPTIN